MNGNTKALEKGIALSPQLRELSRKVRVIRFGRVRDATESPWDKLAGMFSMSKAITIEEMLDAQGFEKAADYS